ncbi:MAG: hypothetical protein ILA15_05805 [Clostridiales bacterium]|nr:hypothetical protein [Clostridiales bacterium]
MFLDRLNNEEKVMFLDLAVYAAQSNGIVDEAESKMLMQYCKEMGIAFYDVSSIHSMEEVKNCFSVTSEEKKRIVALELLGLCYIDGDFDSVESAFAEKFSRDIGVSDEVYKVLTRDIDEYVTILSIIEGHLTE